MRFQFIATLVCVLLVVSCNGTKQVASSKTIVAEDSRNESAEVECVESKDICFEEQEVQYSEIDMSLERSDRFYTYFRIINKTNVRLQVLHKEFYSCDVFHIYIDPYRDGTTRYESRTEFMHFAECFEFLYIWYDTEAGRLKVSCTEDDLLNNELWTEEIIDENSAVHTFVITQQMYEQAVERYAK